MKTLRRIVLIIVALMVCAGTANAKIASFGIKAGLNVNKLHFSKAFAKDLIDNNNSTGWEAGVMAEFNVPIIGIGADISLMYARMNNATLAVSDDYEFDGATVGKNFIMIPINLKYKLNLPVISNYIVPFVFTGPDFAFQLNKHTWNNIKSRTCQVAWNVGLGVEFVKHLQIAASYGFGINKIANTFGMTNQPDFSIKNNYWTVTAAWLF